MISGNPWAAVQRAGWPHAFYEVINQGGTAVNPPLVELCRSIRGFSDGERGGTEMKNFKKAVKMAGICSLAAVMVAVMAGCGGNVGAHQI